MNRQLLWFGLYWLLGVATITLVGATIRFLLSS